MLLLSKQFIKGDAVENISNIVLYNDGKLELKVSLNEERASLKELGRKG